MHGARGEDPTEPHASAPYPHPAVSHEPRIQQLSDDLAGGRAAPVPRAVRRHARRGRPAQQPLRALRDVRRLPVPGAREVRRRGAGGAPGADASERDAAHPLAGAAAGDQRGRHGGHRRGRRARRRAGDVHGRHRRRLLRRRELGGAAAVLGERRAPARHRERVRPARAQLHVPQQPGRARAVQGDEPDGLPEDARAQRLLLRRGRLRVPAGEHPDGRQVLRRHVPRREAAADEARAAVDAGPGRPPRGRLLALHRGPAAAGEPRHAAPRRQPPARLPADQPGAQGSGCSPSSSSCSSTSACTSTT